MRRLPTLFLVISAALLVIGGNLASQNSSPVAAAGSLKFAVIGDNGTGSQAQFDIAQEMAAARTTFPFEFVVMMGDTLYGSQDFVKKFERPYATLLSAGIPFYAALGNHDSPDNRFYPGLHMGGQRYYTFAKKAVRFFVLDTNLMDREQLRWMDDTLASATEPWKIVIFHHPIYSDGQRHGSNIELRTVLEPMLVAHGVDVVFSGHEHVYERTTLQKGIPYFIVGASGQLRKGGVSPSSMTAAFYDQDQTFVLVEIAGVQMFFKTITRTGALVDSGTIVLRSAV